MAAAAIGWVAEEVLCATPAAAHSGESGLTGIESSGWASTALLVLGALVFVFGVRRPRTTPDRAPLLSQDDDGDDRRTFVSPRW